MTGPRVLSMSLGNKQNFPGSIMCSEATKLKASRGPFPPRRVSRVSICSILSASRPRLIRARTEQSEAALTIVTRDGASDPSLMNSGLQGISSAAEQEVGGIGPFGHGYGNGKANIRVVLSSGLACPIRTQFGTEPREVVNGPERRLNGDQQSAAPTKAER